MVRWNVPVLRIYTDMHGRHTEKARTTARTHGTILYYQHSGEVPFLGTACTLSGGLVAATITGFLYSWCIVYVPFACLNAIFTIGFGIVIALAVHYLATFSRIRSNAVPIVITLLACGSGYYVAWGTDFMARAKHPENVSSLAAFNPFFLRQYVQHFYEQGAWTFSSGRTPVSGISLGIIWSLEALTIFGTAVAAVRWATGDTTFCEKCGVWSAKAENLARYVPGDEQDLAARLDASDYEVLAGRKLPLASAREFWQLDAHLCPSCDEHACLSVDRVTLSFDNDGKVTRNARTIINKLIVGRTQIQQIVAAAPQPAVDETLEKWIGEMSSPPG
jgi:hypothetical protein